MSFAQAQAHQKVGETRGLVANPGRSSSLVKRDGGFLDKSRVIYNRAIPRLMARIAAWVRSSTPSLEKIRVI